MSRILILAAALSLCACGGNMAKKTAVIETGTEIGIDMHNAENSLDYIGIYKGILPAADCPGIQTTLTLDGDGTYMLDQEYLERDVTFTEKGHYSVGGNTLTLKTEGTGINYKIEENRLRMLGADMQPVASELSEHYVLTKTK